MYRKHGFTLIELVMVITILALLVTIGVPSYVQLIKKNTITTTSNELLAGLLLARSEAVRQETKITFTPETNGKGWTVKSKDGTLLDHTIQSNDIVIAGAAVTYNARGRACLAATQSIDISYNDTIVSRVCLDLSGRPFIKKGGCI
jgi:type IV fimbrial biogenesis protein FimT